MQAHHSVSAHRKGVPLLNEALGMGGPPLNEEAHI